MKHALMVLAGLVLVLAPGEANEADAKVSKTAASVTRPVGETAYAIGSGDQIRVWALGLEDLYDKPLGVDPDGFITLPLAGRIAAAGNTVEELRDIISRKLASELKDPQVTVTVAEYKSHPVSVLGAVNNPGVHYLQGPKNLTEVLAMAGGLRTDAGYAVKITRTILAAGHLPLASAKDDETGKFSIAEVPLKVFLGAQTPGENIPIRTNDVITVPRAELVYVIGEVSKAGGFVLNEREEMSSVQALSLAGGMTLTAAPKNARILRYEPGLKTRKEIPINVAKVLRGKAPDVPMRADDILFVPNSTAKHIQARLLDASLNLVTGVIIWRR